MLIQFTTDENIKYINYKDILITYDEGEICFGVIMLLLSPCLGTLV